MDEILKTCCSISLILACWNWHLTSTNICSNLTSSDYNLEPYLNRNLYPDSRLKNSSEFHLVAEANKVITCCQECCNDDSCLSVFFHEGECFLVRCSIVDPRDCPYGIVTTRGTYFSNWTWVSVREISNVRLKKHLEHFPAKMLELSSDSMTFPLTKLSKGEETVYPFDHMHKKDESLLATKQTMPLSVPTLIPFTATVASHQTSTMQPPTTTTAVPFSVKSWTVSAGESRIARMPSNNFSLRADVVPEPLEKDKGLYSYQWVMVSSPPSIGLGHMDNMSSPTLELSMLREGNYTLKVIVTRGDQSNEAYVNVTVLPTIRKNAPPVAKIVPSEQKLDRQNDLVLDGSESTDDDKILSYKWELRSGPATVAFPSDASFDSPVFKLRGPLAPGSYSFRLTVIDSNEASNYTEATVEVIKEVDYPPKANAGSNRIIQLPVNDVTLAGNASFDDKGIVSYEWTKVTNDLVNDMTGARTPFLQLSNLQEGDYTFALTVTDASDQTDKAEVHVIVKPAENRPPSADAGANRTLFLPIAAVDLDASNSSDDGSIASYSWKVLNGPDDPRLENADRANAELLNPSAGVYVVRLEVKDEMGLESVATVYITIKQNQNAPPVSKAGDDMEVELVQGDVIIINGSSSYDDKGISSFLWLRDNKSPAAGVAIKNSDGTPVLQLVDLVKGRYAWTLRVEDVEGLSDESRMTLTVKGDSKEDYLVRLVLGVDAEMFNGLYKDALQSHLEDIIKKGLAVPESRVVLRRLGRDPVSGRCIRLEGFVRQTNIEIGYVNCTAMAMARFRSFFSFKFLTRKNSIFFYVAFEHNGDSKGALRRFRAFPFLSSHLKLFRRLFVRTVVDFYAESHDGGSWTFRGSEEVEDVLKFEVATRFSNILEFPIVDIFSVVCHRNCSGHGKCNRSTRKCICDTFWTSNWFKASFGSRETNCDWSILYVAMVVVLAVGVVAFLLWYVVRAIKRRSGRKSRTTKSQGSVKKRHKYTLLNETSNGIEEDTHRDRCSDKGRTLQKALDRPSDSGSSGECESFLGSTDEHRLRKIRGKVPRVLGNGFSEVFLPPDFEE